MRAKKKAKKQTTRSDSDSFLERLKSRKFIVSLIVLAIGAAVDLTISRGLSSNLLTLLLGVLGTYTAGNAVEYVGSGSRSSSSSESNGTDVASVHAKKVHDVEQETAQLKQDAEQAISQLGNRQNEVESNLSQLMDQVQKLQESVSNSNKKVNAVIKGMGVGEAEQEQEAE